MQIITRQRGNGKLAKAVGSKYYNCGISLAPHKLSGHQVCPSSTPKCRAACLGQWGRAEIFKDRILSARVRRTRLFFQDRNAFVTQLLREMESVDRYASKRGLKVAFRPNILSDLPWWRLVPEMFAGPFRKWQFYGYTKVRRNVRDAIEGKLPPNYHTTFSWSERASMPLVREYLAEGVNVAIPFFPAIPHDWKGHRVINGEKNDLRFLDPKGVIVGLTVKRPKRKSKHAAFLAQNKGFLVDIG